MSSNRTDFTLGLRQEISASGGAMLDKSVFLLNLFGHDPFYDYSEGTVICMPFYIIK